MPASTAPPVRLLPTVTFMAETDDKARVFRALDRMRADGASDEQMRSFVQWAKTKQSKQPEQPDLPRLNPRTGMPLETYPDMGPGKVTPDEAAQMRGVDDIQLPPMSSGFMFFPEDAQLPSMTPEQRREALGDRVADVGANAVGIASMGVAPAATVAGRLLAAAAAGGAGGLVAGGARKAIKGRSPEDLQQGLSPGEAIAKSASDEGAMGAIIGGGLHLTGEAGAGIAGKLRSGEAGAGIAGKLRSGEAGAGIAGKPRSGEGWLARFLKAKDAGAYKDPAMKALPKGTKGVQEAGEIGHGRVVKQQMAKDATASAAYDEALHGGPDYTPPAEENPLFAAAAARNRPPRMLEAMPDERIPSAPFPRERPQATAPGKAEAGPQRLIMPPDEVPETPLLGPVTDRGARYEVTPGGRVRRPGATEAVLPPGERSHGGDGGELAVMGEQGVGPARKAPPGRAPPVDSEYAPPPEGAPPSAKGPEEHYTPGEARGVSYEAPARAPASEGPGRTEVATGLDRPVDRATMLSELRAGRVANINGDTRLPADKAIDKAFREAIKALGGKDTVNTVGGTLKLRRAMMAKANFPSANPTREELAARHVYQTFRAAVRKAAPDVAAADDAFAANARSSARDNDILTGSEDPAVRPRPEAEAEPSDITPTPDDPQMRVGKEQAGVRRLKREGDVNEPGNMGQKYLDELRAKDGEYAKALDFIGNKKAQEATRFGAPHLATDLKGATAHVAGVPVRWAGQNLRALTAHAGDPAARALAKLKLAAPFAGSANPLFEARDEEKKRLKLSADFLRAGKHQ